MQLDERMKTRTLLDGVSPSRSGYCHATILLASMERVDLALVHTTETPVRRHFQALGTAVSALQLKVWGCNS